MCLYIQKKEDRQVQKTKSTITVYKAVKVCDYQDSALLMSFFFNHIYRMGETYKEHPDFVDKVQPDNMMSYLVSGVVNKGFHSYTTYERALKEWEHLENRPSWFGRIVILKCEIPARSKYLKGKSLCANQEEEDNEICSDRIKVIAWCHPRIQKEWCTEWDGKKYLEEMKKH